MQLSAPSPTVAGDSPARPVRKPASTVDALLAGFEQLTPSLLPPLPSLREQIARDERASARAASRRNPTRGADAVLQGERELEPNSRSFRRQLARASASQARETPARNGSPGPSNSATGNLAQAPGQTPGQLHTQSDAATPLPGAASPAATSRPTLLEEPVAASARAPLPERDFVAAPPRAGQPASSAAPASIPAAPQFGSSLATAPVLDVEASAAEAANLARRTREEGIEPVMMCSTVHLEAEGAGRAHARRIEQAAAARIPFVLTFGKTSPGEYDRVIRTLQQAGPLARAAGVMVLIKQHGGNSATGEDCARILREAGQESVKICYDAGNVLDYENKDPIADIAKCWRDVRAFAIKDHRNTPKDEDCGPGFGEIDHYKLLAPVMRTGLTMPLAFENIFEPLVPRPASPEGVDALARRAREYVETVLRGLAAAG